VSVVPSGMQAWTIYVVGVIALGLAYQLLKQSVSSNAPLICAIVYLVLLSWIGHRFGRK